MRQRDRDEFIAIASREGIPLDVARKVLRHSATLHRLSEAACSGDWPCDNGERRTKECPECQSGYAPSSFRKGVCPDCRTQALVRGLLAPHNVTPIFNGDPRGAVVKLRVPSGATDDWGREGICVPV